MMMLLKTLALLLLAARPVVVAAFVPVEMATIQTKNKNKFFVAGPSSSSMMKLIPGEPDLDSLLSSASSPSSPSAPPISASATIGVVAPLGFFDPLGFSTRADANSWLKYREAEITHGRVAMLAVTIALLMEYIRGIPIIDDDHHYVFELPRLGVAMSLIVVANVEFDRAIRAYDRSDRVSIDLRPGTPRQGYEPGDMGLDPWNLVSSEMRTKELQHGRLAMIGIAGIVGQELVDHRSVIDYWMDRMN